MEIEFLTKFQVAGDYFPASVEGKENVGVVSSNRCALRCSRSCKRNRKPLQDITRLVSAIHSVDEVIRPSSSSAEMQPLFYISSLRGGKRRKATNESVLGHKRASLRKSFR